MRLILAIALATSALWSAAGAQLPEVGVYNEAGLQLVDNARTIVQLRLRAHDDGAYRGRFDCASAQLVMREGILEATATIRAGEPTQLCEWVIDLPAGTLAAGGYQVVSTFWRADGVVYARFGLLFDVIERGTVCNASPARNVVELIFPTADASAFMERLAKDDEWRRSLGNLQVGTSVVDAYGRARIPGTFDALADPYPVVGRLRASGYFQSVTYAWGSGCGFLCPGGTVVGDAVEYRQTARERYILVTDPAERDALDSGAIAGWSRTGESVRVILRPVDPTIREGLFHPTYRFWGGSVTSAPSHFFTASQRECAVLRDRPDWHWTFEGSSFWTYELQAGECPSGIPLHRVYNNGIDGAPAHRYSGKRAIIDEMVRAGWVDEGPVMCVAGQAP